MSHPRPTFTARDVQITPLDGPGPVVLGAFDPSAGGARWNVQEWALHGDALAFGHDDGDLIVVDSAPFVTRLVVQTPTEGSRNGDVVLEWLNVTVGSDHAFDWARLHVEMERTGTTWVGVSAQFGGIEPHTGAFGRESIGLRATDPERYGTLRHPGDRFAQDIFARAAAAVRERPELTGGPVRRVVAVGHSQSASMLGRHAIDVAPASGLIDGFLIHGRGADAAPLDGSIPPLIRPDDEPARFPGDGHAKVLQVLAETDVVALGAQRARQSDDESIVTWEVAGGAHVDTYLLRAAGDPGSLDLDGLRALWEPSMTCFGQRLDRPMNAGPQRHVLAAALRALRRWVTEGSAPSVAAPLELDGGRLVLDRHGIARGGVRSPAVDAAIVRHSGVGNSGPAVSYLCGVTDAVLDARPIGDGEAVERASAAADAAVDTGHLLVEDRSEVIDLARIEAARTR